MSNSNNSEVNAMTTICDVMFVDLKRLGKYLKHSIVENPNTKGG